MLRVRVLGGLAIEADDVALPVPASRPARELLAWLALHPGSHPRLELAMRFWPDVLETSARASLRTTLHELRRAVGDEPLVVDRETVGLAPAWVDLLEVERLASEGRAEDALALCAGEPLVGIERDWATAARDEHRDRVSGLLTALADAADSPETALRWTRERARLDPLSEEAARRLMTLHAETGDRAAAVAVYTRLSERLRRELSIPPSRQTRELMYEIRAGGEEPVSPPPVAPAAGTPPLPPSLAARTGPFAGRRAELAAAVAACSPGGVLLLAGEPGIGKTRLLAEAARVAHARGATVLYGRCHEEQLTPYEPFVEALTWLAGVTPVRSEVPELARLVPALGPAPAAPPAEGERWRLFEGIAALLAPPAVLLLDDLHWADAGTLRLLAHLLRRAEPPAVVGAYRDSEISRTHPLADALADLRRDGLVERLPLRGLDEPAVAELVGDRPALAAALHRETGGNPFFVEEVLRHGVPDDGTLPIPEGVKDVIGRRLTRLGDDTGRVLSVASVAGREFGVALLEALLPDVDVLAALEEAESAQMVRETPGRPGRYGFVHALIRETLYDELSLTRRVRTHAALADALEGGSLAELAHHRLEAAAAGNAAGAADAALAAAREAQRALAYEEAAMLCERALAALEDTEPRRRAELLLALGDARLRAGEPAREAFAAAAGLARELGEAELLARAALGYSGLGVTIIAVDETAVGLLEEALAALSEDHPLRGRVVARLAIETYYACTPEQRKALGDEAVELARTADATSLLDALNARHAALWSAAYLDERLATADEMIALARQVGDAERELQGRNWRVVDLMERGDLRAARAEIEAHEALAKRLRLPAYQWWGPLWGASLATLEGRFADADRLIGEIAATDDDNARLYADIQRYGLMWSLEDFPHVDLSPVEREAGRPAEYAYRAGWSWMLAMDGQDDAARAELEWIAHDGFARLRDDMNHLAALAEMTQALALLNDPTHAAAILERLQPYADRNILNGRGASGYGSAAHHVAVLKALTGERDDAAFEAAIAANAALGSRPWVARTQQRYAQMLRAHGEPDRAAALARQALETARELGIAPLADRASLDAHPA